MRRWSWRWRVDATARWRRRSVGMPHGPRRIVGTSSIVHDPGDAKSSTERTRAQPERRASLGGPYTRGGPAILTLNIGKEQFHYFLYRLRADFGRGFRLEKFRTQGEEVYDVSLDLEH